MIKLKYLFLLVLCAGLIGSATIVPAQMKTDDKILIAGKKPLRQSEVDKLIEFYEWAFEITFPRIQREQIQLMTENDYRQNQTDARKYIDDFMAGEAQIFAADENVQREARKLFLKEFIAELRKQPDGDSAQFFLAIYKGEQGNAANVAANNTEESNETEEAPTGNIGNLSRLVGKWVWGRSGSSTYSTSSVYMGSNGSRHTYQFAANGTVEYTGIMNVMTGGCNMQIFKSSRGKASISGNTLTINWAPSSFSRDDSCSPSKNYKKTLPAETETLQVSFKDSYGQRQLCLTGKDETCFSPTK